MNHSLKGSPRSVVYVLFDDLRAEFDFLRPNSSSPRLHTPHFDALARHSTYFSHAYAQTAFCVPSRASFLTGLRPDSSQSVHNDQSYRVRAPYNEPLAPRLTIFHAFRRAGYGTSGVGKVFHFAEQHPSYTLPSPSWALDLLGAPCDEHTPPPPHAEAAAEPGLLGRPKACELPADAFVDHRVLRAAAAALDHFARCTPRAPRCGAAAGAPPPFFLAVGFHRPHNPYHFPLAHLRAHAAAAATPLPAHAARRGPAIAYADGGCASEACARQQVRFYRGAVSWADALLGALLAAVRRTAAGGGGALLAVHADHGFCLGEQGAWQKRANWDAASRVPLFIARGGGGEAEEGGGRRRGGGGGGGGRVVDAPVQLVDVFPTLLELAGVPPPERALPLEGASLAPLLAGGGGGCGRAAYMLQPRLLYLSREGQPLMDGGAEVPADLRRVGRAQCSPMLRRHGFGPGAACLIVAMGYSVRTAAFRYTRWERWNESVAPPARRGAAKARAEAHDAPLHPRSRFWAAGEGELLAEELYNYSATPAYELSGAAEAYNLAGEAAAAEHKRRLYAALVARPAHVRGVDAC